MMTNFSAARIYTDATGLADLKQSAKNHEAGSLEEAASQFESLFIGMMLKTIRDANIKSSLSGSDRLQFHQDMFDQQLALQLGSKRSLGIADMLVRQLGKQPQSERTISTLNATATATPAHTARELPQPRALRPERFESIDEFIQTMRPLAQKAAAKLGVDAGVLIAQSALETGWGKKIIRQHDGASSHNLFGIKAHRDWQGPVASVSTLEFSDGGMQRTRASFRVYESFAESFEDYADFLLSNPRYQDAINNSGNPREFVMELQTAGYATDPDYASKIIDILGRGQI